MVIILNHIKVPFIILFILYCRSDNIMEHFYENIKLIDNPYDYLVLVNKNNKLDSLFIPNDLEEINLKFANKDKKLRGDARIAFEKLSNDAYKKGLKIIVVSAFRAYSYQKNLYNKYVIENGLDYADRCSARAGHSEHQTGLAIDIMGSNNDYNKFHESKEFNWMINNAHKYGFILRYPKGKEHITGFKYEPWHYRYVGIEAASIIHEKKITLEEYIKTL